jgi:protein-S-isoprenylcysteine O-methyltransferase Ste14
MAVLVPWLITGWQLQPALFGFEAGRYLGVAMMGVGGPLLLVSVAWFAREGVRPYPPIERVVTTGPYAYTRNPMYVGVVMLMLGQGLWFGSLAAVLYALGWLTAFVIFVTTIDDPFIQKRIGPTYDDYVKSVPGWIPRRPKR